MAGATMGALRFILRRAEPDASFASAHFAPLLCGALKSFLLEDVGTAETRLRRGLVAPTERFRHDSPLWAPHVRVKAFLRKFYLNIRYRGTERYRNAVRALHDQRETGDLQTVHEVEQLFGLSSWCRDTIPEAEDERKVELLDLLQNDDDTTMLSLEDILEAGGACVFGRNEFNAFCENHNIFDYFTRDYVDELAELIKGTVATGSVLEVGAGDGALSHHLRRRGVDCTATDSGSWRIFPQFQVERLDVESALAKYRPTLVVAAWMPLGVDWTQAIRSTSSVQAYILIGESDGGACGHPWLTWGHRFEPEALECVAGQSAAPYVRDGFVRVNDPKCTRLQISRYDSEAFRGNSRTVIFHRSRS